MVDRMVVDRFHPSIASLSIATSAVTATDHSG
jgi:hypothetical protein